MAKVAVVTDSTATIPDHLLQQYHIMSAPLQVIWGQQTYQDGVDLQPTEFYDLLETATNMPTTSQPSPAVFQAIYRDLLNQGYDILSIHISGHLSGTLDSALQARNHFADANIAVVDSQTTAMALGFSVLQAARAAEQGASLAECRAIAEKDCGRNGVFFAVSTLEFLRRGGRIGGAAAFLGTALNLKPLLELRGGKIEAVERVRTMSKAVDRLIDIFLEHVGEKRGIHLASLHANAPAEAQVLLERVLERFPEGVVVESLTAAISPVLGTHTGPGCVGLVYLAED